MSKNIFILTAIIFLFSVNIFAGGPWTLKKNKSYLQVSYNIIASNNHLFSTENKDKSLFLSRAITDQTTSFYGEYGVTDKFTLITHIPFKYTKNSEEVLLPLDLYQADHGTLNSFGNTSITGKYQFYKKKVIMAADLSVSFPTGKTDTKTRLRTGYDTYGIQPGIHFGYSKDKFYTYGHVAYNYRTKLTDEYKLTMELGYKLYKGIFTIVAFDIVQSTKVQAPRTNEFTFLYQDQQEYIASTLKLSKNLYKNMGINLHMTILTVHANYVQKGPAMGGSIYWKF